MHTRDRGFALVLVLIATAGVFALAMQAAVYSRSATIESRVMAERAQVQLSARAAASLVIKGLLSPVPGRTGPGLNQAGSGARPPTGSDSSPSIELPAIIRELLGSRADDIANGTRDTARPSDSALGRLAQGGGITGAVSGAFTLLKQVGLPSTPIDVTLPDDARHYSVTLRDAAGQLNINMADETQLRTYFTLKGIDPTLAATLTDQLLDWIDKDDFVRPRGAEAQRYVPLGVACPNRPIRARRELLYLPAMTPAIFAMIRDDLSLSGDGLIHVPSASREVLMTLPGITSEIADRLKSIARAGLLDDDALDEALPLSADDARDLLRTEPSPVMRVRVESTDPTGGPALSFEGLAVIRDGAIAAVGLRPAR